MLRHGTRDFQVTCKKMPREWFMTRAGMSDRILIDAFERDFKV